jgi:hypothetical protein
LSRTPSPRILRSLRSAWRRTEVRDGWDDGWSGLSTFSSATPLASCLVESRTAGSKHFRRVPLPMNVPLPHIHDDAVINNRAISDYIPLSRPATVRAQHPRLSVSSPSASLHPSFPRAHSFPFCTLLASTSTRSRSYACSFSAWLMWERLGEGREQSIWDRRPLRFRSHVPFRLSAYSSF